VTGHHSRDAAEQWFLDRGLPAALTPRARSRYLLARSAPATGRLRHRGGRPACGVLYHGLQRDLHRRSAYPTEQIVLTVIALVVPLAVLAGWTVSQLHSHRAQSVVSPAAMVIAAVAGVIQGGFSHLLGSAVVIVVVALCTTSGVSAVLGWASRLTMVQIAAMGAVRPRTACGVADRGGVPQHLRLGAGVDDQRGPPVDRPAVSAVRVDRLHRLGKSHTGAADARGGQRPAQRRS
jgi:hypothetical protein